MGSASQLVIAGPFTKSTCQLTTCRACALAASPINCSKRNLVYEVTCNKCVDPNTQEPKFVYIGETCRSAWERTGEYWCDYIKSLEKSHMLLDLGQKYTIKA